MATGRIRIVKEMGVHNHYVDATAIPVAQFKDSLKRRVATTMENPAKIFNDVLPASQAVQAKLTKSASRKIVQRTRIKEAGGPAIPGNIAFRIPEAYRNYDGGLFLLGDSNDMNRVLMFGREDHILWAQHVKVVFADGTFSITPEPFQQVYVILAERGDYVFPILYCLLLDKSQETYEKLFGMIKQLWPEFSPSSFSVDFELAAINAINHVFPTSKIYGCLFHLVQNMKKKLSENGMKGLYDTDPDLAVQCRMIPALAFVNAELLREAASDLWEFLPDDLETVMTWFMKNYVGQKVLQGRRLVVKDPKFAIEWWNVYQRTLDKSHRTNNYAEAANHRIQGELGVSHPSFWHFVDCLKQVQKGRDQLYSKWLQGDAPKPKRIAYVLADDRILAIVEDSQNRSHLDYLRGVAMNFIMRE